MTMTKQIKERPILFSGEMVRAILDGRKTQTRRVLQQPRRKDGIKLLPELLATMGAGGASPYGKAGDRLYVREAWQPLWATEEKPPKGFKSSEGWQINYPATDGITEWHDMDNGGIKTACRPSIHMPRWASRIMLEIVDVRVERVQDISPDDCLAEGINYADCDPHNAHQYWRQEAYAKYGELWNKINAARSYGWAVNPWVWVIEFKKLEATQCPA